MKIVKNKSIYILRVIKKELQLGDLSLEMRKKRLRIDDLSWECRRKECELLFLTGKWGIKEYKFSQYSHSLIPHFFSSAFFSFATFSSLKVAIMLGKSVWCGKLLSTVYDHEWLIFLFGFSDLYGSILLTYLVGTH